MQRRTPCAVSTSATAPDSALSTTLPWKKFAEPMNSAVNWFLGESYFSWRAVLDQMAAIHHRYLMVTREGAESQQRGMPPLSSSFFCTSMARQALHERARRYLARILQVSPRRPSYTFWPATAIAPRSAAISHTEHQGCLPAACPQGRRGTPLVNARSSPCATEPRGQR